MTYINHINMCLEVKNLAFSFNNSLLVENLDFKIEKNEVGLVAGASGIGKSTLLNILSGLKIPDKGSIKCNDKIFNNENIFVPTADGVHVISEKNGTHNADFGVNGIIGVNEKIIGFFDFILLAIAGAIQSLSPLAPKAGLDNLYIFLL